MGKRCQVCDGPVVNGRCKYCGMPYRNDAVMYHLNEDRSEHYRHASEKVRKAMKENEIPLPDRTAKSTAKGKNTSRSMVPNIAKKSVSSAGQSRAVAGTQNVRTYTGKTQTSAQKSSKPAKKSRISTIFWVVFAGAVALYSFVPDSLDVDSVIEKVADHLGLTDADSESVTEEESQELTGQDELDEYECTFIDTDIGTYVVGETGTEDDEIFMPGEYIAEAGWEAVALEITEADTGKEKTLTFDKAKQQVDLELHTGDELKVISLDDQYNYFAMYQIQQYDE